MSDEYQSEGEVIQVSEERDIVICRQACREWAKSIGFNLVDQTRITTSASELARNIHDYAGTGEVTIEEIEDNGRTGIKIVFKDEGPGIANLEQAMGEGWTSKGSMGMGLPGSKKLMDDFEIISESGKGTTVTIWKWMPY
ncbi:MAG: anti-sigma regulatory factor [FCB group bacterium]|nr:anti-sigma regulatory factor [FCB group bacterium]